MLFATHAWMSLAAQIWWDSFRFLSVFRHPCCWFPYSESSTSINHHPFRRSQRLGERWWDHSKYIQSIPTKSGWQRMYCSGPAWVQGRCEKMACGIVSMQRKALTLDDCQEPYHRTMNWRIAFASLFGYNDYRYIHICDYMCISYSICNYWILQEEKVGSPFVLMWTS